jgi:1-acyl-sn-glycerol-3-phosphate acyltransferase
MLNKKAQALIEFVLLLPVIVILIFSTIDIFNLVLRKNSLITRINDEVLIFEKKDETIVDLERNLEREKIDITFDQDDKYTTITAKKEMKWISPITASILKNYTITVKRVIPFE